MTNPKIGDVVLVPVDAPDGNGILAFCKVVDFKDDRAILSVMEIESNYLEISSDRIYEMEPDEDGKIQFACSEDQVRFADHLPQRSNEVSNIRPYRSGTKLQQAQQLMIDSYTTHSKRQIIEIIAMKIHVSLSNARTYYNKILKDGYAPGHWDR